MTYSSLILADMWSPPDSHRDWRRYNAHYLGKSGIAASRPTWISNSGLTSVTASALALLEVSAQFAFNTGATPGSLGLPG